MWGSRHGLRHSCRTSGNDDASAMRLLYELRTGETADVEHAGDGRIQAWVLDSSNKEGRCHREQHLVSTLDFPLSNSTRSRSHCVGQCCAQPLARNRSCAFRDLLFRPPTSFFFLADEFDRNAPAGPASRGTFLHNRFVGGGVLGEPSHSYFSPPTLPPAAARGVSRVVESPIYLGADLHPNQAHLMLDSVFPSVLALLRLRASLRATGDAELEAFSLPDALGDFTFLLLDPWGGHDGRHPQWHRGSTERTWAHSVVGGHGVIDLAELAEACPAGCLIRRAFAGAGHLGLCAIDRTNAVSGAREHRALWHYRSRIFSRFGVPHAPPSAAASTAESLSLGGSAGSSAGRAGRADASASSGATAAFGESKRVISNLDRLVAHVNTLGFAAVQKVRWEALSFAAQLRLLRSTAVLLSGVGSAQMNHFLLPRGSVGVCLGWRSAHAKRRIQYYDSHLLRSLDYVRAMYYPSYDPWELDEPHGHVRLNLSKASRVIADAVALHQQGFEMPVPPAQNANRFDRAWEALVEYSGGQALMDRSNDRDWVTPTHGSQCINQNGLQEVFFGGHTERCVWGGLLPRVRREFDL